jgi:hypothetical protein
MGDGEFIGGATALWTAAHYRIPVLIVVANNRSYYTDEVQQEAVAVARGRPPENKWIGQRLDEPAINIAGLASDLGFATEPVVRDSGDIQTALERGLAEVEKAKADGRWDAAYGGSKDMEIPADFLTEIAKNADALAMFKTLNRQNLYAIYYRVSTAKNAETRARRIANLIATLARGERFH